MDLSERKKQILRAVIEQYVETAEPVGSKVVASYLALSPATIRNEMAELESMELLEQPHTSAGRIPTATGYRIYVNELMRRTRLTLSETEAINRALRARVLQLDKLLSDAGSLTSRLTSLPAYALTAIRAAPTISRFDLIYVDVNTFIIVVMLTNDTVKNKLIHIPAPVEMEYLGKLSTVFNASFTRITQEQVTARLISATERAVNDDTGVVAVIAGYVIEALTEALHSESHISGTLNLFDLPEYSDSKKARKLISYLSDDRELIKLPAPGDADTMKITIGPENLAQELRDSSVVVARYDIGEDMQGLIGVVGPTRMDYPKIVSRLSYIARGISALLSGNLPNNAIGDETFDETEEE